MESSINKRNWWIVGGLYCFLFLPCWRPNVGDQPAFDLDCFRWGSAVTAHITIIDWQKKENLILSVRIASIMTVYKPVRPLLVYVAQLMDDKNDTL